MLDAALLSIESSISGLSADGVFVMASPAVGEVVYGTTADHVALADADDAAKVPPIGVVAEVVDGTHALVRFCGIVPAAGSFTTWTIQYLDTTAGALVETAPATPNVYPVGISINTTDLLVLPIGVMTQLLKSIVAKFGSTMIGFDDPDSKTTAATVGAALKEQYVDRLSTSRGMVPIPLSSWRIVSATGDVGNIVAIGGVLASNSDPILLGEATTNSWIISWAANSVIPIGVQVPLPPDLDDTGSAFLDLSVFSGSTDAATMALASSWDGGSEVTDSADDSGTKSATRHTITATIAASDIPAGATHATFRLTPPAHTTNAIALCSSRLRYTPKLVT